MTDESTLLSEHDKAGGVLTLTINRPHRKNAIDLPTWGLLRAALTDAADNPDVRALVLTGAGGDFCSGADLGADRGPDHPLERMRKINQTGIALHELPVPSVAKVTGVAVGAGANLALGCDLVVATPKARFSQIFAKRGLSLDLGGSYVLPRLVGMQQAKRLALLAEMIGAQEAKELGLVTWVVPEDEVDEFAADVAKRLAAAPPVALAQTKAMLNASFGRTIREALDAEATAQTVNFGTEDAKLAFQAFANKTEPDFTGRWMDGTPKS